jgi:hypothetical protein
MRGLTFGFVSKRLLGNKFWLVIFVKLGVKVLIYLWRKVSLFVCCIKTFWTIIPFVTLLILLEIPWCVKVHWVGFIMLTYGIKIIEYWTNYLEQNKNSNDTFSWIWYERILHNSLYGHWFTISVTWNSKDHMKP